MAGSDSHSCVWGWGSRDRAWWQVEAPRDWQGQQATVVHRACVHGLGTSGHPPDIRFHLSPKWVPSGVFTDAPPTPSPHPAPPSHLEAAAGGRRALITAARPWLTAPHCPVCAPAGVSAASRAGGFVVPLTPIPVEGPHRDPPQPAAWGGAHSFIHSFDLFIHSFILPGRGVPPGPASWAWGRGFSGDRMEALVPSKTREGMLAVVGADRDREGRGPLPLRLGLVLGSRWAMRAGGGL